MSSEAIWTKNGLLYDAEDFLDDASINPKDFECERCRCKMQLVSHYSDNLLQPHFRQRDPHAPDCPFAEDLSPTNPTPGPGSVRRRLIIDELVLPGSEEDSDLPDPDDPDGPSGPGGPNGPGGPSGPWGRRRAGSVRAVARLYREIPALRNEPLRVLGCRGDTYGTVFRVLSWNVRDRLKDRRIYFGSLLFGAGVLARPDGYEVTFVQGVSGDRTRKFRLLVRTAGWTQQQIRAVKRELDLAVDKTLHRRKEDRKNGTISPMPWIFFLGDPVVGEEFLFAVNHPLAVCSIDLDGPGLGIEKPARA